MQIAAIKAVFPGRVVSNDDMVQIIRAESEGVCEGDVTVLAGMVDSLLKRSGIVSRSWLAPGERPIDLVLQAIDGVLEEAGIAREQVDMLIHTGVDRRFAEPGQSHMVAKAGGLLRTQCMDVLDACNSWSRATQVTQALLDGGQFRHILVVNGEFNSRYGGIGMPQNCRVKALTDLEWLFSSFTIGEAATATLFTAGGKPWRFQFTAVNENADYCTVPLDGFEEYAPPSPLINKGAGRFISYAAKLSESFKVEAIRALRLLNPPKDKLRLVLPHAFAKRSWDEVAKMEEIDHLMWNIYPRYGNVVSASVPAGLATAIEAKKVNRGELVLAWVAAAGMSHGAYLFEY